KRNDGQRQRHEEDAAQRTHIGPRIYGIRNTTWERDLEEPEKGKREDQEDQSKSNIEPDIGGYAVEDICVVGFQKIEWYADQDVDQEDEKSIQEGIGDTPGPRTRLFSKKADGERNHRECAGHDQTQQAAEEPEDENAEHPFRAFCSCASAFMNGVGQIDTGQPEPAVRRLETRRFCHKASVGGISEPKRLFGCDDRVLSEFGHIGDGSLQVGRGFGYAGAKMNDPFDVAGKIAGDGSEDGVSCRYQVSYFFNARDGGVCSAVQGHPRIDETVRHSRGI